MVDVNWYITVHWYIQKASVGILPGTKMTLFFFWLARFLDSMDLYNLSGLSVKILEVRLVCLSLYVTGMF